MREIKFRAGFSSGCLSQKVVIEYFSLTDLTGGVLWEGDPDEEHVCETPNGHALQYALFVDEYIGLLDKNGREIYEGDIIKDPDKRLVTVKYTAPEFFPFDSHSVNEACFYTADKCSVVGNIHDNPELVKEE